MTSDPDRGGDGRRPRRRVSGVAPRTRPGEWLEHSWILPALIGLLTLGWLVHQLATLPFLSVISSLNAYLIVFLILGLVLHGTPRAFLDAIAKAVPTHRRRAGQYPLYAAMAAVLTGPTAGRHDRLRAPRRPVHQLGDGGAFAVVIALYTAFLGLLVPSGGGQWLVEAPYVMQSATDVQMNLGWTVQIYNAAEALPNLVNPFFMLPLLAVLGPAGARPGRVHVPAVPVPPAGGAPAAVAARHDVRLRSTGPALAPLPFSTPGS